VVQRGIAATAVAIALFDLIGVGTASACPRFNQCDEGRPALEWSTWIRLGYVIADLRTGVAAGVAAAPAPPRENPTGWEAGLGADMSLALSRSGDVRIGGWGELRTSSTPVVGAELLLGAEPAELNMFWYRGEGILSLRAGGNRDVATGSISCCRV